MGLSVGKGMEEFVQTKDTARCWKLEGRKAMNDSEGGVRTKISFGGKTAREML